MVHRAATAAALALALALAGTAFAAAPAAGAGSRAAPAGPHSPALVDGGAASFADHAPRTSEDDALGVALADARVVAALTARGLAVGDVEPTTTLVDSARWEIDLRERGVETDEIVVRVDVRDLTGAVTGVWTGHQIAWTMARGDRYAFGGDVNAPVVWIAALVLFALLAIDWSRPLTWWTGDVVALTGIAGGHEAFQRGAVEASTLLVLPVLAWLLVRCGWIAVRGPGTFAAAPARLRRAARVPTVVLVVVCVLLAGIRVGLVAEGGNVIDVGYAGVAGARAIVDGRTPYGSMPADVPHGDTYGPLAYAAYVPAVLLLDERNEHAFGGDLPAATWTAIVADLLAAAVCGLVALRWWSRRAAALAAALWLASPWTLWSVASAANDALVAVPLLLALALLDRRAAAGALVAAAGAVKLVPFIALAPLLALRGLGARRRALAALAGAAAVTVVCGAAVASGRGGLATFVDRTVTYQASRESPFSVWGLAELGALHVAWEVVVVLLALALVAAVPAAATVERVAAGMAGLVIAAQLALGHWSFLYVPWFLGPLLVVLVAARVRAELATAVRS